MKHFIIFLISCFFLEKGWTQELKNIKSFLIPSKIHENTSELIALRAALDYYESIPIDMGATPLGVENRLTIDIYSHPDTVQQFIGNITLNGSSDFLIQNNGCVGVNIPAAQHCYFDIVFSPTSQGEQVAVISVPYTNIFRTQDGTLTFNTGQADFVVTASTEDEFRIEKTILNEANPNFITIEPSIKPCGKLRQVIKSKIMVLKCIDISNDLPVSGCYASMGLQTGLDNGGHKQSNHGSPRPLQFANRISTGVPMAIPIGGLRLVYEAPEVSGDVNMKIDGVDPNGEFLQVPDTTINVRIPEDTMPLDNIFGFYFDLANMSHQKGIYGTSNFNDSLNKAIGLFRFRLISSGFTETEIPLIESEGASLPLGGLFDYENTWGAPHCTHRDGKTIDISFSAFDTLPTTRRRIKKIKQLFLESMTDLKLTRNPENQTHWHFVSR